MKLAKTGFNSGVVLFLSDLNGSFSLNLEII